MLEQRAAQKQKDVASTKQMTNGLPPGMLRTWDGLVRYSGGAKSGQIVPSQNYLPPDAAAEREAEARGANIDASQADLKVAIEKAKKANQELLDAQARAHQAIHKDPE